MVVPVYPVAAGFFNNLRCTNLAGIARVAVMHEASITLRVYALQDRFEVKSWRGLAVMHSSEAI